MQPTVFGAGYSTFRAWVNGTSIPQVLFSDITTDHTLLTNLSNATIDLCARKNYNSTTSTNFFGGDMLNFLWFRGASRLFVNTSGISSRIS